MRVSSISTTRSSGCVANTHTWTRFSQQRKIIPLMFATLPSSSTKALSLVRAGLPQFEMGEIDDNGSVLIRPGSQSDVILAYKKRSLMVSAAKWAESKLGMKRAISINEGRPCLEGTQKTSAMETATSLGASSQINCTQNARWSRVIRFFHPERGGQDCNEQDYYRHVSFVIYFWRWFLKFWWRITSLVR